MRGILNMAPRSRMNPYGKYPKCRNKLGTYECERCGNDVRLNTDKACSAIPKDQRFDFLLEGETE